MTELVSHVGMRVERTPEGIRKTALNDHNAQAVDNERRMLLELDGLGIAPQLLEVGSDYIVETDLGDSIGDRTPDVESSERLRRQLAWLVAAMRSRNIRHGDLSCSNMIISPSGDVQAIDWQEGHLFGEKPPQATPLNDSYNVLINLRGIVNDENGTADTPRVARRWLEVLTDQVHATHLGLPLRGKTFVDWGCFQGDFCAWAAVEGMNAVGVDTGGFRTGEDSIEIGRGLWDGFPFGTIDLRHGDIPTALAEWSTPIDISIMFSTWAYIVAERGQLEAEAVIARALELSDVLYFETQLHGDGPGWEHHRTDDEVREHLTRIGGVAEPLRAFPVTGRPASRMVWRVTAA
jgi:hypothetical protein